LPFGKQITSSPDQRSFGRILSRKFEWDVPTVVLAHPFHWKKDPGIGCCLSLEGELKMSWCDSAEPEMESHVDDARGLKKAISPHRHKLEKLKREDR
jgi:hypothetical protein